MGNQKTHKAGKERGGGEGQRAAAMESRAGAPTPLGAGKGWKISDGEKPFEGTSLTFKLSVLNRACFSSSVIIVLTKHQLIIENIIIYLFFFFFFCSCIIGSLFITPSLSGRGVL